MQMMEGNPPEKAGLDPKRGRHGPEGEAMTDDDLALYGSAISFLDGVTRKEAAKMRGDEAIHQIINKAAELRGIVLHPDDPA